MTQKDFIVVAKILYGHRAPLEIILYLAEVFKGFSPNFDSDKFIIAAWRK